MKRIAMALSVVLVGVVATLAFAQQPGPGSGMPQLPNPKITVGKPAPEFTLKALDGTEVKLSSLKDKVVVLDFWATWCRPCRQLFPELIEAVEKFKDKGVVLYAVNQREPKDLLEKFIELTKFNMTVLMDESGAVGQDYLAFQLPHTVIIKDGIIQSVHTGLGPDAPVHSLKPDGTVQTQKLGPSSAKTVFRKEFEALTAESSTPAEQPEPKPEK